MKKSKFQIGQNVIAMGGVGRWGEYNTVTGKVVDIQESLTSSSRTYIVRTQYTEIVVSESELERLNAKEEEGS